MWAWHRFTDWANSWPTLGGSGVAEEAAAFVHGQLLQRLEDTGGSRWVLPWVWLNAAAHGTIEELTALAEPREPVRGGTWAPWWRAEARIAREVLSRSGGDPAQLRRLQQLALIPLESQLHDDRSLSPGRLVEMALDELRLAET
jgi:hypothetical protein